LSAAFASIVATAALAAAGLLALRHGLQAARTTAAGLEDE